jgi:hypothetical protein
MQLAPHPMALLDWIPGPGDLLGDLLLGLGWLLSCVPPSIGYLGYIILAIWLTRWVLRHVRPIPLNPESPLFQQPGGWRPWMQLNWFQAILVLGATEIGFSIPQALANTIWRNPITFDPNELGVVGHLAEIVGLVCHGHD